MEGFLIGHGFAAKSTYVKVHLEGDRTVPLFSEGTDDESAVFSSKPLIFVVIHSNAVATVKVRDKKEGAQFYGQVPVLGRACKRTPKAPLCAAAFAFTPDCFSADLAPL